MNVRLSYDRTMGGTYGTAVAMFGQVPVTVTLLKPSESSGLSCGDTTC
jgi:hypothetical protein